MEMGSNLTMHLLLSAGERELTRKDLANTGLLETQEEKHLESWVIITHLGVIMITV